MRDIEQLNVVDKLLGYGFLPYRIEEGRYVTRNRLWPLSYSSLQTLSIRKRSLSIEMILNRAKHIKQFLDWLPLLKEKHSRPTFGIEKIKHSVLGLTNHRTVLQFFKMFHKDLFSLEDKVLDSFITNSVLDVVIETNTIVKKEFASQTIYSLPKDLWNIVCDYIEPSKLKRLKTKAEIVWLNYVRRFATYELRLRRHANAFLGTSSFI